VPVQRFDGGLLRVDRTTGGVRRVAAINGPHDCLLLDGFLHLTSRAREVIMVEGHVRYAAPIERILAGHPDVDQAYVVGAPDEQTGEAIHAFVIPRAGRVLDPDTLSSLIRVELGGASVPRSISAVADVPLTPGGKPDKDALLRDLHHRHNFRHVR